MAYEFHPHQKHKLDSEELRGRLRQLGVRNVEPRRSGETTLGLPAGQVGFAFVSNVLHEVEGLPGFLAEVFRVLGPG